MLTIFSLLGIVTRFSVADETETRTSFLCRVISHVKILKSQNSPNRFNFV